MRVAASAMNGGRITAADELGYEFDCPAFSFDPTAYEHRVYQGFGKADENEPLVCGGQVVMPGDIMVGDSDGIVVIPRRDAADLLSAVRKNLSMEQDEMRRMKEGTYEQESHREIFTGAFLKRGGSFV